MSKAAKKETFEGALEELENLVRELESGDKSLEDSLGLFEKGVALSQSLSRRLEEARHKVEVLAKENGKLVKKPLDGE